MLERCGAFKKSSESRHCASARGAKAKACMCLPRRAFRSDDAPANRARANSSESRATKPSISDCGARSFSPRRNERRNVRSEAMTPLQCFAETVTKARTVFDTNRDFTAWLVFYETRQTAYTKLAAVVPQVKEVEDFWRYVQNMPSVIWLPMIEGAIERITKSRCLCARCQEVKVSWPERFCDGCRKIRRSEAATKSRQTRKLKEQMRKCPICLTTPLLPRQRKCADCKESARRDRNRRYQRSFEESKIRRLQPNLTREAMLTVGETDQLGSPTHVLTAKAS